MKSLKMLALAVVAAAALLAISGGATASAAITTVLCTEKAAPCPETKADKTGTEIKATLIGKTTTTTSFKNIECSKSSFNSKVTSTTEKIINATVETLTFEECNCTIAILKKGTLELERTGTTGNATVKWSGTEKTVQCETIFGPTHCIYKTEATDIGTLEGGTPAKFKVVSANIPRLTTSAICAEQANWDAEYEVTSPKPLFVEEEGTAPPPPPAETVLCTESKNPCPAGKADGVGTEIKASLVSGTKSKLTTIYNNIECGKSSLTAKVTGTGKTISTSVEALTFEECNCEVKVLGKGTLELAQISTTATNATVNSTNTEIDTTCITTEGSVHCVYKTTATDLGTLEGGNPAKIKISAASIPRLSGEKITPRCAEGSAAWDAEYEVTSPKPLYTEPEIGEGTVLCSESVNPCPSGKANGSGTEIKASLVSGTKSKLTTPYNNIECGKSSLTDKVTGTGEKISGNIEALTFEECNCSEFKVVTKGTLELARIASSTNATVTSTNTEISTTCSTITGNVHCTYKTTATDLGTLEGGNPAKIKVSSAEIPVVEGSSDARCKEGGLKTKWDVEYEVTSPKPLYIEPK